MTIRVTAPTLYAQEEVPVWEGCGGPGRAFRDGLRGRFPPRYRTDAWRRPFDARLAAALPEARAILDVGAGALPTVPPDRRPTGCTYVGLDVDHAELDAAPAGSYDEAIVADVTAPVPALEGRFDLVLSWFVLEHVRSLRAALSTIHSFLAPGGRLLAQFSGRRAFFALLNRLLPGRTAAALAARATRRGRERVFPAPYDDCRYARIVDLLAEGWDHARVMPIFVAGVYFRPWPALLGPYLAYEEVAYRRDWRELAPYYLVDARRAT